MAEMASVLEHGAPPSPDQLQEDRPKSDRIYFEIAPYDEETGLSHFIAPPDELLNPTSPKNSWHHRQGTRQLLIEMGEIGRGVRASCIQLSRNRDHNKGKETFHTMTGKPYLPPTMNGKISVIVLNAMNAVTDQVFDVRQATVRPITSDERDRLFSSGEVLVQSEFAIRRSLARFTIKKGIQYLEKEEERQFKDAESPEDKEKLVNLALGRFLPLVFKTVDKKYQSARERGFLPEGAPRCAAEVAGLFVFEEPLKVKIFQKEFDRLIGALDKRGPNVEEAA